MIWNEHSKLKDQHAFLGGSNYHWQNYDKEKLKLVWKSMHQKELGTKLHNIASQLIKLRIRLPNIKKTMNMFVNDAIALNMNSEQTLYYSPFAFGTADAISFSDGYLRIHDLKTGNVAAHMEQLKFYAAVFCLEYLVNPKDITTVCSIYQNDEVIVETMTPDEIQELMDKIVEFNSVLNELKETEDNGIG